MPITKQDWDRIRSEFSPQERQKISAVTQRLKEWAAAGCPEGKKGRPRLFFGMPEELFKLHMKECDEDRPNVLRGYSLGMAFDGNAAWRAHIQLAFAPEYYWVWVENSHIPMSTFHNPFHLEDVGAALQKFAPGAAFQWAPMVKPPSFSHPNLPARVVLGLPKAFFAYDGMRQRFHIGNSHLPSERCQRLELELLGTCGLDTDIVRMKFTNDQVGDGWYAANPRTMKKVAKLCAVHSRTKVLK